MNQVTEPCPCGSGKPYHSCCGLYLERGAYPHQVEALMRSRYTAYTRARVDYLQKTWHPDTCPSLRADELKQTHWQRLEVIRSKQGLKKGVVEFKAFYLEGGREHCLHEVSLFKKFRNRWVYLEAEHLH